MNEGMAFASSLLSQLVGKPARNVTLGHGSFITMDFGNDIIVTDITNKGVTKRTMGEWYLWVYMTPWRLDKGEMPIVGAEDLREHIAQKLCVLENKKVVKTSILNASFDAIIEFEGDLKLRLFAYNTTEHEQWFLWTPNPMGRPSEHIVFTAGPGSDWTFENSNE